MTLTLHPSHRHDPPVSIKRPSGMIHFQAPESGSDVQLSDGDKDFESSVKSAGRTPVSVPKGQKRKLEVRIRCRRNVARIPSLFSCNCRCCRRYGCFCLAFTRRLAVCRTEVKEPRCCLFAGATRIFFRRLSRKLKKWGCQSVWC